MFNLNLKKRWQETLSTINRFPLAYLAAIVITASLMVYSQLNYDNYNLATQNAWLARLAITGVFGFFMFYTLHLLSETKKLKKKQFWAGAGLVVLLLVLIYYFQFQFFEWRIGEMKNVVRTLLGLVAVYLSACSLAFWGFKTKENAFWQYVLRLGIRIAQAFVVFGILFGGIAALLGTVSFLFDVKIAGVVYTHVFIVLAALGATSFVLRGVDANINSLDKEKDYPKFIELVAHYVLIPLVYVYAAVVLVYLVQALIIFEWPKYGTSELLGVFLLVGLSAFMLTFPHAGKKDWAGFYHKYYFVFALIIAAALLLGISVRIAEFGFTVNRYLVGLLGVFIVFISFWKLLVKNFDIRNIHYTAIVFILVALYGPLSAFSATWYTQTSRLEAVMNNEATSEYEIRSIITSLSEVAFAPKLESYLNNITQNNEFSLDENSNGYEIADQFIEVLGVDYSAFDPMSSYVSDTMFESDKRFSVNLSEPITQINLEDYKYYFRFEFYNRGPKQTFVIDGQNVELTFDDSVLKLGDYLERDLSDFLNLFTDKPFHNLPAEDIEIRSENYVIQFEYIDGIVEDGSAILDGVSGYILLK